VTVAIWCFTAYQSALAVGAHSLRAVLANIMNNAVSIQAQDNDALSNVLTTYGAKENTLIAHGQYWRFVTPIFLHANLLHVGLNMLNFVVLGVFLERLVGHARFLLIYLVTGIISIIASYSFAPQEISVGASGAIFGLVGAYSVFVLVHRQAFPRGGVPALLWLVLIIGVNLGLGLIVPNVDNYAHVGGLLSGCLLGWWFTPLYTEAKPSKIADIQYTTTVSQSAYPTQLAHTLVDTHSLARRWPLALLTLLGTLALAVLALHLTGG
jgi:rhomboid protease GluP